MSRSFLQPVRKLSTVAGRRAAGVGRVTTAAFIGSAAVLNDGKSARLRSVGMALAAGDRLVCAIQREAGVQLVIETGGLPVLVRVAGSASVRFAANIELSRVNVLVTARASQRSCREDYAFHAAGVVRAAVAFQAGDAGVGLYEFKLCLAMVELDHTCPSPVRVARGAFEV